VVPSVRTGNLLQDEIRICADWDLGVALAGADGIPRQPTFLPEHELCGSAARERDRPRMDVGDEERMPDADLREFVAPETVVGQVGGRVALLDQKRHAFRTDSVDLLLHEACDGCEITAFPEFVKPISYDVD